MPNLIIPTYGTDFLDENGKVSRVWLRYFQTLYDKTGEWDASAIEQQFSANGAAIAELAKATPDDAALVTIASEINKTLQDLSLQLAASISAGVELQKRFDELQIQVDGIKPVSIDNLVRELEIRIESIPDASAAVAEIRKSALTKASKLSALAPTTSAEFATVITDETGTGKVVFNTTPTLVTPVLGVATGSQLTLSGVAGSAGTIAMTDTTANGVNLALTGNGATTPSKFIRVLAGNFEIVDSAYGVTIFSITDSGNARVFGAFGCNSKLPQTSFAVGAAATDLPTVIALANNLRTMSINNGIAS